MMRAYLLGLIFYCVSKPALSEPVTWLMQGDMFTDDEATSRLIQLDSHNSYFSVSTRAEMYYAAQPGKLINCVIAAAVYQKGHVSVVEGGYGSTMVRVRYMTKNGETDVFAVFLQSVKREMVSVDGNFVNSTRLGIVYEPVRNWTQQEVEDVLRNITTNFPLV
ncbi:hypothetical protein DMN91_008466 [Ooceraea biroi]|uniref:Uncharacterized protein n=1 Tax=Ooceraea biroi TaxID=2015173 RepID=A0A026WTT8_OOCBI|nr:uncharacterized protein LOC105275473 [Ooceraea biroi]EZA59071.1 hypothetical protein X777_15712 [Ooceraea biroi]RLU19907.1 hypothetical protein DMN91_008466 [Ooceraea biroi]